MTRLSIIMRKISNLWGGLRWLSNEAPMICYEGYTCGCYGEGCNKESKVLNKYSFVKGIEV